MPQLTIFHQPQQQSADCLAACSAMLLTELGISFHYRQLLKRLKITKFGASFHNLKQLHSLGVHVTIEHDGLERLEDLILSETPAIVFVETSELSYWDEVTSHAVVVVGFDDEHIFVNDPILEQPARRIPRVEFELAWIKGDYLYATIEA